MSATGIGEESAAEAQIRTKKRRPGQARRLVLKPVVSPEGFLTRAQLQIEKYAD